MNTSALKSFAPAVRRQLMEAVTRKLDYVLTADTPDLRAAAEQVKSLRKEAERDRAALIERVAYTWFNRLAAIRFLDARGWHPFHARVLTPASAQETQPELLKLVRTGSLPEELRPHTDPDRLNDLLDGRLPTSVAGADSQGEVYRHLVLAVCRFYHATLPFLFERLNDETELLLPDDLLTATSVAEGFRTEIGDADCAGVEILGWLYQFYIAEKKDAVMARNAAVPKDDNHQLRERNEFRQRQPNHEINRLLSQIGGAIYRLHEYLFDFRARETLRRFCQLPQDGSAHGCDTDARDRCPEDRRRPFFFDAVEQLATDAS